MTHKHSHDDSLLNPFPIKKLDDLIRPFIVPPGQKISLAKDYDPDYKADHLKKSKSKHKLKEGHVTNGVHMPSWESSPADDLWTGACGKERWLGTTENLGQDIRRVCDTTLWQFRTAASKSLVEYARQRLSQQLIVSGASSEAINGVNHLFSPNVLTLGFARRFATYKRPNLLLHDRGFATASVEFRHSTRL